ncbi:uncharacterized protein LOC495127 [Xenopus laevis]|uniref:Proteasome inhibitor PI31 subunit n=3 Tax=Xenopus laevis TaxID=8355 RepID=A0A974BX51_XENLA
MASPGLELLFSLFSSEISRPTDSLICFIHWELICRGLRCLGRGEEAGAQETGSERLPVGWAENKDLYTLCYGSPNSQILLKALTVEGTVIVNIMDMHTEKVADVTLQVSQFIDSGHLQEYDRVYKNAVELKGLLDKELILPVFGTLKEPGTNTWPAREQEPQHDPLRVPPRHLPSRLPAWTDPHGHPPYGAADLDPLGGHSGGMVFDPFRGQCTQPRIDPLHGLPPGAVPPGARFDPFGPIGSGRPRPDPDHLPPPGYDDMFL